MRTPKHGVRRTLLAAAVPVGMVVSGALVWQSSYAAFTASTENAKNSWASGTVTITDDDGGVALFDTGLDDAATPGSTTNDGNNNLKPGDSKSRCITVTYTGSVTAASIELAVATPTASGYTNAALDNYLRVKIEKTTAPASGHTSVSADCTGFDTATASALYNSTDSDSNHLGLLKSSTATTPITAGSNVGTNGKIYFKISYTVIDDNNAQNKASNANFTWTAKS